MALQGITLKPKQEGGKGGLFGKILGSVAGGAAGFLAGGPAGAVTGAGLGGKLGGTVGQAVDPAKVTGGKSVGLSAMAGNPEVKIAQLMDAQKELMSATDIPEPEKVEIAQSVFNPALEALKRNLGR